MDFALHAFDRPELGASSQSRSNVEPKKDQSKDSVFKMWIEPWKASLPT